MPHLIKHLTFSPYIEVDMKDLIIVCAGGFGKEAVMVAMAMNEQQPQWNIVGFIDDALAVGTEVYRNYKVVGSIEDCVPQENQYFVLGISNPQVKSKLYDKLKQRGAHFATLISPQTNIPTETQLEEGCVISLAWIGINVKIGKCVHIAGSMVGEASIDDFSTTTGFANIAGAQIGKRVFVGSHAVVLNGRRVGDDAFVCAGSIVFNHVKEGTKVLGNPAKRIDI